MKESILSKLTAPNTIGILEEAIPSCANEYLVFSAHMDHIGITPGPARTASTTARTTTPPAPSA